ncbi:hypothetical protein ABBQ38_006952 [Trebouxia sp. C0009 RCD-2024]
MAGLMSPLRRLEHHTNVFYILIKALRGMELICPPRREICKHIEGQSSGERSQSARATAQVPDQILAETLRIARLRIKHTGCKQPFSF